MEAPPEVLCNPLSFGEGLRVIVPDWKGGKALDQRSQCLTYVSYGASRRGPHCVRQRLVRVLLPHMQNEVVEFGKPKMSQECEIGVGVKGREVGAGQLFP